MESSSPHLTFSYEQHRCLFSSKAATRHRDHRHRATCLPLFNAHTTTTTENIITALVKQQKNIWATNRLLTLCINQFCEIVSGFSSIQSPQLLSSPRPSQTIPGCKNRTKALFGRFNDSLYDRNFFPAGFERQRPCLVFQNINSGGGGCSGVGLMIAVIYERKLGNTMFATIIIWERYSIFNMVMDMVIVVSIGYDIDESSLMMILLTVNYWTKNLST